MLILFGIVQVKHPQFSGKYDSVWYVSDYDPVFTFKKSSSGEFTVEFRRGSWSSDVYVFTRERRDEFEWADKCNLNSLWESTDLTLHNIREKNECAILMLFFLDCKFSAEMRQKVIQTILLFIYFRIISRNWIQILCAALTVDGNNGGWSHFCVAFSF